jgi:hypothetical protein
MNTPLIHWQQYNRPLVLRSSDASQGLFRFMDRAVAYLAAALTLFAVVIGTAWLTREPAMIPYVQAAIGTSGLLFFGLAIQAETVKTAWLFLATGTALPLLAVTSARTTPELLVLAALGVGAWLGAAVTQLGRTARR